MRRSSGDTVALLFWLAPGAPDVADVVLTIHPLALPGEGKDLPDS